MAEKRTPVTTVRVDYMCEECGEEVEPTGQVHATYPYTYVYSCLVGHTFKSHEKYPRIEYVPIN